MLIYEISFLISTSISPLFQSLPSSVQSGRAVKYTDCISASLQRVKVPTVNGCPGYDNKSSDGEIPVLKIFGSEIDHFIVITPSSTMNGRGSTCLSQIYGSNRTVRRYQWCNSYRRRKGTRRHEFKSWTRLIAFHIALIPLGKVWIQLFTLQLWVNSRKDGVI